ncbi:MAG: hypothetical protein GY878_03630 [Fuerstiella sp.]|nr:hypothetical protein [Gammaproteobacteria bacterium]MCP4782624.1 hypothetical protein [Fuerstiella sp.]
MAGTSDNLSGDILDAIFNGTNLVAPSNVYVSLHTGDPGTTDVAAAANEVSTGSYARQDSGVSWVQTDADTRTSNVELNFDMSGSTGATLTHFALWSTASGASGLLASAALTSNVTFAAGDIVTFASGAIVWNETSS